MRRVTRGTAIAALVGAALAMGVTPATAGDGLCSTGYVCGYDHPSYDGALFGTQKVTSNWNYQGFGDRASSVSANGATCKYSTFHKDWNILWNAPSGDSFQLYSRTLLKTNYRDPDLRNGAGNRPGVDFDDKISGTTFTGC